MLLFQSALKALATVINDGAGTPLDRAVDLTRKFEGGTATYRRKAGDKTAVAKIDFDKRTMCLPLMKAMKVMTGDQTVEWAIAHVSFEKRITEGDISAGCAALVAVKKARAKEEASIV